MSLVADLAEYQLEYSSKLEVPFFSNCALVRQLIDLTASGDLDLHEKVNMFIVLCCLIILKIIATVKTVNCFLYYLGSYLSGTSCCQEPFDAQVN